MNVTKILNDLINSASCAKAHFEVYWTLVSDISRPRYINTMNEHNDFFRTTINAHYTAFFVYFAHLYDPRRDSSSIPNYLKAIDAQSDPLVFSALQKDYERLTNRAKPLLIGRHKSVAHIDITLTEKEVFQDLPISWNEIRSVVYDSALYVAKLAGTSDLGSIGICRDNRLSDSTAHLLATLSK